MPAARRAYGSELRLGDGGGNSTFTKVAKVIKFNPPGGKRTIIDASDHDSANGAMEFIGGMIDYGEISGELNYINDETQQDLESVLDSGVVQYWQVVIPTNPSKQYDFQGILQSLEPAAPSDGKLAATFSIKITGSVART